VLPTKRRHEPQKLLSLIRQARALIGDDRALTGNDKSLIRKNRALIGDVVGPT
jgi:hypothetical protein